MSTAMLENAIEKAAESMDRLAASMDSLTAALERAHAPSGVVTVSVGGSFDSMSPRVRRELAQGAVPENPELPE